MEKICKICNETKSISDFHKNKNGLLGRYPYCKICRSTQRKTKRYEKKIVGEKRCTTCKISKSYNDFSKDISSRDGCQSNCKTCQNDRMKKYYNSGGIERYFQVLFNDLKQHADTRKIDIKISLKYVKDLYTKQKGLCALSGIKMTSLRYQTNIKRNRNLYNISVNRIDSSQPYTENNIQLVCSIFKTLKRDLSQHDFINFCRKISQYNKN